MFESLNKAKNIVIGKIKVRKAMKIKSQHRDIFRPLGMLIIFFKLMGLGTFNHYVIKQGNKSSLYIFKYSKLGIVYNVVLIILQIATNLNSIPQVVYAWIIGQFSKVTLVFQFTEKIFGTLMVCITLFSYCINQKSFVHIINRLMDVEHELDRLYRLYPLLKRQCNIRFLVVTYTLQSFFIVILIFTQEYAFHEDLLSDLLFMFPMFHMSWYMFQYTFLITIIRSNFADVNCAIQSLSGINTSNLQPQTVHETPRIVISNFNIHELLQLRGIYCYLYDISKDISHFYSVPILFGFGLMFMLLLDNAYFFVLPLLIKNEWLKVVPFINTIFWFINIIYPVFLLTSSITNISNENIIVMEYHHITVGYLYLLSKMKKLNNTVDSLLNCTVSDEAKSELKYFSLELLHRKVEFTANGYFTLDNDLLYSIVATTVAYLVILVQFQMAMPSLGFDHNYTQKNLSNTNVSK